MSARVFKCQIQKMLNSSVNCVFLFVLLIKVTIQILFLFKIVSGGK